MGLITHFRRQVVEQYFPSGSHHGQPAAGVFQLADVARQTRARRKSAFDAWFEQQRKADAPADRDPIIADAKSTS